MKLIEIAGCFILAVAFSAVSLQYEASAQVKAVHIVDVQRVLAESDKGKAAKEKVEEQVKAGEARLAKMKIELEKKQADLQKQASLLSTEAIEGKRREIEKFQRKIEDDLKAERDDLKRLYAEEMKKAVGLVDEAVKKVSDEGGYELVIERDPRLVIYVNDRYDITSDVIKKLNSK